MYKKILMPTDGSTLSQKAIEHGVSLAQTLNAEITFVAVTTPFHSVSGDPQMVANMPDSSRDFVHDYLASDAASALSQAQTVATDAGVQCDALRIEHDHIYQGIIDTATDRGCDLILMASHGHRGLVGVILGSVTQEVLAHSTIPVLVYR